MRLEFRREKKTKQNKKQKEREKPFFFRGNNSRLYYCKSLCTIGKRKEREKIDKCPFQKKKKKNLVFCLIFQTN